MVVRHAVGAHASVRSGRHPPTPLPTACGGVVVPLGSPRCGICHVASILALRVGAETQSCICAWGWPRICALSLDPDDRESARTTVTQREALGAMSRVSAAHELMTTADLEGDSEFRSASARRICKKSTRLRRRQAMTRDMAHT